MLPMMNQQNSLEVYHITLKVAARSFHGTGNTLQSAKHDAATK